MDHIIMEYGIWLTAEYDRKSIEHFYKQSQFFLSAYCSILGIGK